MKAQQVASAYCKAVIRPQSVPKTYVFQNNPDLPTASPKTRIVLINNSAQVEPICATLLKEGKLDSLQGQCVLVSIIHNQQQSLLNPAGLRLRMETRHGG